MARSFLPPGRGLLTLVVLPAAVYLLVFAVLTAPLLGSFSTRIWADQGDGLQNAWNLWWTRKAITELHRSPWFTRYLHFPHGTTLLGHTLNPFNGLVAVPLLRYLTLFETYNVIVLFSFVAAGVTAFWLAGACDAPYAGALLAGALYTFSGYHFAHTAGHLQLVSLEWVPLFLLAWQRLLARPGAGVAVLAALSLLLVILCDYYYFVFALMAAGVMGVAYWAGRRAHRWRDVVRPLLVPLAVFGAVVLATSGLLVLGLLRLAHRDPLLGVHPASVLSLDLLGLLVPGKRWRFAGLTEAFWSRTTGNAYETSVQLGAGVLAVCAWTWWHRGEIPGARIGTWVALGLLFFALSLGPQLHVVGRPLPVAGPYRLLERLVPPFRLSGCPVRMAVMCSLSGAVICGAGIPLLWRRRPWLTALVLVLITIELLPAPLVTTVLTVPEWVRVLEREPDGAGLVDRMTEAPLSLYYQTVHGKPMAEGYIARIPASVSARDGVIVRLYERGDWAGLCERFGIRYAVVRLDGDPGGKSTAVLYEDDDVRLLALGPGGACRGRRAGR